MIKSYSNVPAFRDMLSKARPVNYAIVKARGRPKKASSKYKIKKVAKRFVVFKDAIPVYSSISKKQCIKFVEEKVNEGTTAGN
jgi:hypothetical protein